MLVNTGSFQTVNSNLLWGIVAYDFGLLGFPGGAFLHEALCDQGSRRFDRLTYSGQQPHQAGSAQNSSP